MGTYGQKNVDVGVNLDLQTSGLSELEKIQASLEKISGYSNKSISINMSGVKSLGRDLVSFSNSVETLLKKIGKLNTEFQSIGAQKSGSSNKVSKATTDSLEKQTKKLNELYEIRSKLEDDNSKTKFEGITKDKDVIQSAYQEYVNKLASGKDTKALATARGKLSGLWDNFIDKYESEQNQFGSHFVSVTNKSGKTVQKSLKQVGKQIEDDIDNYEGKYGGLIEDAQKKYYSDGLPYKMPINTRSTKGRTPKKYTEDTVTKAIKDQEKVVQDAQNQYNKELSGGDSYLESLLNASSSGKEIPIKFTAEGTNELDSILEKIKEIPNTLENVDLTKMASLTTMTEELNNLIKQVDTLSSKLNELNIGGSNKSQKKTKKSASSKDKDESLTGYTEQDIKDINQSVASYQKQARADKKTNIFAGYKGGLAKSLKSLGNKESYTDADYKDMVSFVNAYASSVSEYNKGIKSKDKNSTPIGSLKEELKKVSTRQDIKDLGFTDKQLSGIASGVEKASKSYLNAKENLKTKSAEKIKEAKESKQEAETNPNAVELEYKVKVDRSELENLQADISKIGNEPIQIKLKADDSSISELKQNVQDVLNSENKAKAEPKSKPKTEAKTEAKVEEKLSEYGKFAPTAKTTRQDAERNIKSLLAKASNNKTGDLGDDFYSSLSENIKVSDKRYKNGVGNTSSVQKKLKGYLKGITPDNIIDDVAQDLSKGLGEYKTKAEKGLVKTKEVNKEAETKTTKKVSNKKDNSLENGGLILDQFSSSLEKARTELESLKTQAQEAFKGLILDLDTSKAQSSINELKATIEELNTATNNVGSTKEVDVDKTLKSNEKKTSKPDYSIADDLRNILLKDESESLESKFSSLSNALGKMGIKTSDNKKVQEVLKKNISGLVDKADEDNVVSQISDDFKKYQKKSSGTKKTKTTKESESGSDSGNESVSGNVSDYKITPTVDTKALISQINSVLKGAKFEIPVSLQDDSGALASQIKSVVEKYGGDATTLESLRAENLQQKGLIKNLKQSIDLFKQKEESAIRATEAENAQKQNQQKKQNNNHSNNKGKSVPLDDLEDMDGSEGKSASKRKSASIGSKYFDVETSLDLDYRKGGNIEKKATRLLGITDNLKSNLYDRQNELFEQGIKFEDDDAYVAINDAYQTAVSSLKTMIGKGASKVSKDSSLGKEIDKLDNEENEQLKDNFYKKISGYSLDKNSKYSSFDIDKDSISIDSSGMASFEAVVEKTNGEVNILKASLQDVSDLSQTLNKDGSLSDSLFDDAKDITGNTTNIGSKDYQVASDLEQQNRKNENTAKRAKELLKDFEVSKKNLYDKQNELFEQGADFDSDEYTKLKDDVINKRTALEKTLGKGVGKINEESKLGKDIKSSIDEPNIGLRDRVYNKLTKSSLDKDSKYSSFNVNKDSISIDDSGMISFETAVTKANGAVDTLRVSLQGVKELMGNIDGNNIVSDSLFNKGTSLASERQFTAEFDKKLTAYQNKKQQRANIQEARDSGSYNTDEVETLDSDLQSVTTEAQAAEAAVEALLQSASTSSGISDSVLDEAKEKFEDIKNDYTFADYNDKAISASNNTLSAFEELTSNGTNYVPVKFEVKGSDNVETVVDKIEALKKEAANIDLKIQAGDYADSDELKGLTNSQSELLSKAKSMAKQYTKSDDFVGVIKNGADNYWKEVQEKLTENIKTQHSNARNIKFKGLNATFDDGTLNYSAKGSISALDSNNKAIQNQITATGKYMTSGQKFIENVQSKFKSVSEYLTGLNAAMTIMQQIKQGFSTVSTIDAQLTNINKTMGVTAQQLNEVKTASVDLGVNLGKSSTEVLDAVSIYANANETATSIVEKAKPTVMLSNASGADTSTAADQIQGVVNQFNELEGQETRIVNSYEKISAGLGIDFAKGINIMSEGVSNAGSVADQAGLSFEQFAASVGKVSEKTRAEGSTIGNAYKTILARTSRSKSADEDVSADDRSNAAKALKSIGIDVYDANGEYQDFSVTLDQLSSKWNGLSDAAKAYVSEQMAGVRNLNTMTAIIETWEDAKSLADDATTDTDFIDETQEKHMESLEGKIASLKASLEEMWVNVLNTDVIQVGIDALTNLLNVLNNILEAVGKFGDAIGNITGANGLGSLLKTLSMIGAGVGLYSGLESKKNGGSFLEGVLTNFKGIKEIGSNFLGGIFNAVKGVRKNGASDYESQLEAYYEAQGEGLSGKSKGNKSTTGRGTKLANGLTGFINGWKDAGVSTAVENVESLGEAVETTATSSGNLAQKTSTATKVIGGLTKATSKGKNGFEKFGSAIRGGLQGLTGNAELFSGLSSTALTAIGGVTAGLGAVAIGITTLNKLTNSTKETKAATQEATESYETQRTTLMQNNSAISGYKKELSSLMEGVTKSGKNVSLTSDQFERYHEIVNDIADKLPSLVKGYDSEGNAILSLSKNMEELDSAYTDSMLDNSYNNLVHQNTYKDNLNNALGNKAWNTQFEDFWTTNSFFSKAKRFLGLGDELTEDDYGTSSPTEVKELLETMQTWDYDDFKKNKSEINSRGLFDGLKGALEYLSRDDMLNLGEVKSADDWNSVLTQLPSFIKTQDAQIEEATEGLRTTMTSLVDTMSLDSEQYPQYSQFGKDVQEDLNTMLSNMSSDLVEQISDPQAYVQQIFDSIKNDKSLAIDMNELLNFDAADRDITEQSKYIKSRLADLADAFGMKLDSNGLNKGLMEMLNLDDAYEALTEYENIKQAYINGDELIGVSTDKKTVESSSKSKKSKKKKNKVKQESTSDEGDDSEESKSNNSTKKKSSRNKSKKYNFDNLTTKDIAKGQASKELLKEAEEQAKKNRKSASKSLIDNSLFKGLGKIQSDNLKETTDASNLVNNKVKKKISQLGKQIDKTNKANADIAKEDAGSLPTKGKKSSLFEMDKSTTKALDKYIASQQKATKASLETTKAGAKSLQILNKTTDAVDKNSNSTTNNTNKKKSNTQATKNNNVSAKTAKQRAKELNEALKDLNVRTSNDLATFKGLYNQLGGDLDAIKKKYAYANINLTDNASAIEKLKSNITTVTDNISKINSATKESYGSTGLTTSNIEALDTIYGSLDGYDHSKLFKSTSLGVKANATELSKLNEQYKKSEIKKYTDEIADLNKQYEAACEKAGDASSSVAEVNDAINKRDTLKSQIQDAVEARSQIEGQTNAVTEWQNALSNNEAGDLYDTIYSSGISGAQSRWQKGEVGTNEFKSFVKMFSDPNIDYGSASAEDYANLYQGAMAKAQRYFTEDAGQGLQNFMTDLHDLNSSMAYVDENGAWQLKGSIQDIANTMGISEGAVQAITDKISDMGANFNFEEESAQLTNLRSKANEAFTTLDEGMSENYGINMDADEIGEIDDQISKLDKAMEDAGDNKELTDKLQEIKDYYEALRGEKIEAQVDPDTEEGIQKLGSDLDSLKQKYKEIDNNFSIDWTRNDSDYYSDKKDEFLSELEKTDVYDGDSKKFNTNADGFKEAYNQLVALRQKQHELENSDKIEFKVDTSQLTEGQKSIVEAQQSIFDAIDQFDDQQEDINLGINVDSSLAVSNAQNVISQVQSLAQSADVEIPVEVKSAGKDELNNWINSTEWKDDEQKQIALDVVANADDAQAAIATLEDSDHKIEVPIEIQQSSLTAAAKQYSEFFQEKLSGDKFAKKHGTDGSGESDSKQEIEINVTGNADKKIEQIKSDAESIEDVDISVKADGASSAADDLKKIKNSTNNYNPDVTVNVSAEGAEDAANNLKKIQKATNNYNPDVTVSVSADGAEEAATALKKIQKATNNYNPNVNVTVTASGADTAATNLSKIKNATNNIKSNVSITVSASGASDAAAQVGSIKDALKGIDRNINISVSLSGDISAQVASISASLQSLNTPVQLSVSADTSALTNIQTQLSQVNSQSVDPSVSVVDNASGVLSSIIGLLGSINSKTVTVTVNKVVNKVGGDDVDGTAHVSGSAHASGNANKKKKTKKNKKNKAYARGTWGASNGGLSLMGELGREIVVRGSNWFTVGDNGAQMFPVRKGDIIFNHKLLWTYSVMSM